MNFQHSFFSAVCPRGRGKERERKGGRGSENSSTRVGNTGQTFVLLVCEFPVDISILEYNTMCIERGYIGWVNIFVVGTGIKRVIVKLTRAPI